MQTQLRLCHSNASCQILLSTNLKPLFEVTFKTVFWNVSQVVKFQPNEALEFFVFQFSHLALDTSLYLSMWFLKKE